MRLFLLLPIFLLVLLSGGCSKKPTAVIGQIFVVTKGGENIKMGAVPVRIIPEEQFKEIALRTLTRIEDQVRTETGNRANERVRNGLLAEIKAMKRDDLPVPGLSQLLKEVEDEVRLQGLKNQATLQRWAFEAFERDLPPATAKTDADGRFTTEAASKVWFVAFGRRSVGGNEEEYLWLQSHQVSQEALLQPVLISNESNVNSKEELYDVLAPLLGKQGGLNAYTSREPSADVATWAEKIKGRASELIARAESALEQKRQEQAKHEAEVKAQRERLLAEAKAKFFTNSLGMKFVGIPGKRILICIHETRYADYAAYAGAQSGVNQEWRQEAGANQEQQPVVNVSYEDAVEFCRWLGAKEGKRYRLPTDEEWSAAVSFTKDVGGQTSNEEAENSIDEMFPWGGSYPPGPRDGNFGLSGSNDGYDGKAPVMSFLPNELGIFDLGGNVWEWCEDIYDKHTENRVLRGASWRYAGRDFLRSFSRLPGPPNARLNDCGFRVILLVAGG